MSALVKCAVCGRRKQPDKFDLVGCPHSRSNVHAAATRGENVCMSCCETACANVWLPTGSVTKDRGHEFHRGSDRSRIYIKPDIDAGAIVSEIAQSLNRRRPA